MVLLQGFATRSSHIRDISICYYTVASLIHKHIILFLQKMLSWPPPSCVFARPANRRRHSNRCGFVFGNRSCGIRALVATTYAAHPRQILHLPIDCAERISTHVRSIPPLKCLDLLEYFRPIACLYSISHTPCTHSPSVSLLALSSSFGPGSIPGNT